MVQHRTYSTHSVGETPTTIPPSPEENVLAHITRSTKNGVYSCFGCIQTSPTKAKIIYVEYEIEQRKKAFGVEYLNLLQNSSNAEATAPQLQACIDRSMRELGELEAVATELRKEIEKKEETTKSKIVPKPGTPAAASRPVVESTTSNASADIEVPVVQTKKQPTVVATTAALTGTGDGMISAVSGHVPSAAAPVAAPMEDVALEKDNSDNYYK